MICANESDALLVELDSISQCQRCQSGKGCGAVLADSGQPGVRVRIVKTPNLVVREGSSVLVEIDEQGSDWLWPVFGAYGLPLVGMLVTTGLVSTVMGKIMPSSGTGSLTAAAELLIVFSAIAGLAGGIFAWRHLTPRALACATRSLCLHSARIVAVNPSSEREP